MGYTGFHAAAPTPIDREIYLAECLTIACRLRYGDKSSRMLRTDPAKVFSMMSYNRAAATSHEDDTPEWLVLVGVFNPKEGKDIGHRRPTNDEILTPSHRRWPEFRERLKWEMRRPDFDFWYAPQRFSTEIGVTADFWPLCSAQLIGEMGFAIGESLALYACMHAHTDAHIRDLGRMWRRVRPHSRRPAFDLADSDDERDDTVFA
jgi:hypothetical protein